MTNKMGTIKDSTKQGLRSMLPVIKLIPFVIKKGIIHTFIYIINKNIKSVLVYVLIKLTLRVRLIHTLRDKLRICPILSLPNVLEG